MKFISPEKKEKNKDKERRGSKIQVVGIIAVVVGIIYEIITKAHIGFFMITAGSLVFAIGTKIKGR